MRKIILTLLFLSGISFAFAQNDVVKFQIDTPYGSMKGFLYNDTPNHRDNFIKLVKQGWYEDSPFHRVIKDFMIQGGGNKDGRPDPGYTVPAEFLPQKYIHKKGALAAARMGDNVNPTKASSGSQFYIVQGKSVSDAQLSAMENRINQGKQNQVIREYITRPECASIYHDIDSLQRSRDRLAIDSYIKKLLVKMKAEGELGPEFHYSEEQKAVYRTLGGTPHLDGGYTVFGEITEGFEVIDKIAAVPTGNGNKPVQTVSMKIKILDK
jgi:cyclophilin family peptidyl-prolyl cis-trans isomerase